MPRPCGADWPSGSRFLFLLFLLFKSGGRKVLEREVGRQKGEVSERGQLGKKQYLESVRIIKPFNIKAGKVLRNLVESSPFMGGKTSKVDTLLMCEQGLKCVDRCTKIDTDCQAGSKMLQG